MSGRGTETRIKDLFQEKAGVKRSVDRRRGRSKSDSPFSLRLTADERAYLNECAGSRPLGAYIRDRLLGERKTKRRISRKPKINDQLIASVLSELGASRLASNMNQLAKAANMGTLDVSAETERDLLHACAAIIAMRNMLISALGLSGEGDDQ